MSFLDLLSGLYRHPHLTFFRARERIKVLPGVPESLRPLLNRYKGALVWALEEGEKVQASRFLEEPYRLVCLAAHTFPLEVPVTLTFFYGRDVRRYLAPVGNLSGYLLWAERNLPPPHRMHFSSTTGKWTLEWKKEWKVVVEVQVRNKQYLLFYPIRRQRQMCIRDRVVKI